MKKNNLRFTIISTLLCLLPMIVGAILYNRLPSEIPVHFDINSKPDMLASKNFALFGIPTIMAIFQLIFSIFVWYANNRIPKMPKLMNMLKWFMPVLTVGLYTIMIVYALGNEINVGKIVCFMLGIIFCTLGNYFPKMSYESNKLFIHPKPKDEKSFRKMSKISGYFFIGIGVILLIIMIFV